MVALSQLLALPDLGLRLVQAGAGDPEISWVSNTELLDLGAYLEGGEIILTTGLALGADDPRWRDFVAGLSRARIAGIGFGVGIAHDAVPAALVRAASAYRVALFEVPLPVPFIAVSKALAGLLRADELEAARDALQTQRQLLEGARSEQEPAQVLARLAQSTGKHFAVLTSDGATLASTAGFAAALDPARAARRGGDAQAAKVFAGDVELIDLDASGGHRLALAGGAALSPEGRSIVAAGAMVLGLALSSDRADAERERERWERAADAALRGRPLDPMLTVLAPELPAPERVRVVAVQGAAEDVAQWHRSARSGIDRLIARDSADAPAAGVARAWQIVADDEAGIQVALERAAALNLDAVVGRGADASAASLSRRSAAARLGALSPTAPLYESPRVPVVLWADRDTPLLDLMLELHDPTAVGGVDAAQRSLTAAVLRTLSLRRSNAAGDQSTDEVSEIDRAALRETLYAVFASDGQRGPASVALGIHRNTLRDRIARIERITGRSLGDPDDRAELWFALRVEDAFAG
ncbi:PucR family transcriptional regulator [Leucobacter musarum]|uniref:PucR family transcriptional regulator n=1 Tax=Leucobacter musarum TaxID=1930747 RepID=UPI0006A7A253|nr:PucR family transcriptional regulator [Leucobacter musarum]